MAPRARKPTLAGVKHGTTCYRKGCGCAVGRAAKSLERAAERERAAQRKRDAAQGVSSEPTATVAQAAPAGPASAPGEVEQAVRDELKEHDGAAGTVALSAIAIALAREIDERAATSVAGAARQLVATLTDLRKASRKVDGELAELLGALGN